MRKTRNLLLLSIIVCFLMASCAMPKVMFTESESKYEFDKTVEEVIKSLADNGWEVTEKADMKEHYAQYGFETRRIITLEICKPEGAVKILNDDRYTRMVPFMPMRVAVYEKSDGSIYVSRLNISLMGKCNPKLVRKVMKEGAVDLEKAVKEVVQ